MSTNGKNRFGGAWKLAKDQAELSISKNDDIIIKKELTERTAFENYDPTTELKEPLPVELELPRKMPKTGKAPKPKWKVEVQVYHVFCWKTEDGFPKSFCFNKTKKAKTEKHARQIIKIAEDEIRRQWQGWTIPSPWWKLWNGKVLVDCSPAARS